MKSLCSFDCWTLVESAALKNSLKCFAQATPALAQLWRALNLTAARLFALCLSLSHSLSRGCLYSSRVYFWANKSNRRWALDFAVADETMQRAWESKREQRCRCRCSCGCFGCCRLEFLVHNSALTAYDQKQKQHRARRTCVSHFVNKFLEYLYKRAKRSYQQTLSQLIQNIPKFDNNNKYENNSLIVLNVIKIVQSCLARSIKKKKKSQKRKINRNKCWVIYVKKEK